MSTNSNRNQNSFQIQSIITFISLLMICIVCIKAEKLLKCDFKKYPNVGCRNPETQVCDTKTQICKCDAKHPIGMISGVCLSYKAINESCMGSVQCSQTPNAGCFGLDTEFKDDFWILLWFRFGLTDPGRCECQTSNGYVYNNLLRACVRKAVFGGHCSTGSDCYSKMPNSVCGIFDRCQCRGGFYYDPDSDSCKVQLNYDDNCKSDEGCIGSSLVCVKGQCKCKPGFHFDKYKSSKCEPNKDRRCPDNYYWNDGLADCVDQNLELIKKDQSLNKLNEFALVEPPRIYSIFVILALWICLLFILGNAKRGLRLVEQAVRDQASQYRQCDTCNVQSMQSIIETEDQEIGTSRMSLHSDMSAAINHSYPPPTFDELYPNECLSNTEFNDNPPPSYEEAVAEEVVQLDKHKTFVV